MKIAFIGCGNMGEALLAGLHRQHACYVCEPRLDRQIALRAKYRVTFGMLADVVRAAQVIMLAVKPQDIPDVLAEMRGLKLAGKLAISIAAGVTSASIERALKAAGKVRVVRAMPNLPALKGQGMTGICRGRYAAPRDAATARTVFNAVGRTLMVQEKMMDALTAVSGSGPAYLFLVAECMIKAARSMGFTASEARDLVYQTISGSVGMLMASPDTPDVLRVRVTSKGGTTQAAMDVFFKKNMAGIFGAALKAARERSRQLSR